jgi:single-stranded DNA-specific DHH superfamily exonuclease
MPINVYRGKSAKFAAYVTDANVGISARSTDDEIDMSLRRRQSSVDLNKALDSILPEMEGAQGGGHPAAAGASMYKNDFPKFLQKLAEYVDERN